MEIVIERIMDNEKIWEDRNEPEDIDDSKEVIINRGEATEVQWHSFHIRRGNIHFGSVVRSTMKGSRPTKKTRVEDPLRFLISGAVSFRE